MRSVRLGCDGKELQLIRIIAVNEDGSKINREQYKQQHQQNEEVVERKKKKGGGGGGGGGGGAAAAAATSPVSQVAVFWETKPRIF